MRALITGASGYVGSNLVRYLLSEGWEVHVVTRVGSDLQALNDVLNMIVCHEHNGTSQGMVEIVKVANPETVFHLASLFLSQHQTSDLEELILSNIMFPAQLLEAMSVNGVKQFVNTGTSWEHYNDESYSPVNLYAATKKSFNDLITFYVEYFGMKAVTLKLFDTYGPNDKRPKLVNMLWKTAITQQPLAMSPGEQMIDLVHISDVVRAYGLAADNLRKQTIGQCEFGISSGRPINLKDLVAEFEKATQIKLPIKFGGREYRPREVMKTWSKYKSVPGWFPEISFESGIKGTKPNVTE